MSAHRPEPLMVRPTVPVMELREIIGYLLALLALAGTAAGIWAAWYYAHPRAYRRQLDRERRAMREQRPNC